MHTSIISRLKSLPLWARITLIMAFVILLLFTLRYMIVEAQFRSALADAREKHPAAAQAAETWWEDATGAEKEDRCAEITQVGEMAKRGQMDTEALSAVYLARELGLTSSLDKQADRYREMSVLTLYCGREGML